MALRLSVAALWSVLVVGGVHAQVATESSEVRGLGATEAEAVRNALQQAALQLCGVSVRPAESSTVSFAVQGDSVKFIAWINERIQVATGKEDCRFLGYDVLSAVREDDGIRVRVRVEHATYRVPGAAVERRRLAVLEFVLDEVHLYGTGGGREQRSGGRVVRRGVDVDYDLIRNLQERFRARIEELLTQSRRFTVLDRRAGDLYEREKRLLESADVDPAEGARLGKVLGADYLLYGTVDRIAVEHERKEIRISGETQERTLGAVRARYTLLTVATRQVQWSSSLELELIPEDDDLRPERVAEALLDQLGAQVAEEVTGSIYPPVVTQVTGPRGFVVNRGGKTVRTGDLFEVFALGEMLVDPDTGEDLARLETSVGIARITAVKPRYSLAEMVSVGADIARGMVLRRFRGTLEEQPRTRPAAPAEPAAEQRNYRDLPGAEAAAESAARDGKGLPAYLNRETLRRRR